MTMDKGGVEKITIYFKKCKSTEGEDLEIVR